MPEKKVTIIIIIIIILVVHRRPLNVYLSYFPEIPGFVSNANMILYAVSARMFQIIRYERHSRLGRFEKIYEQLTREFANVMNRTSDD